VPYSLRFAARSDVGKVRAKNDDSAYTGRYLAVVADGMGGHAGGNIASASTVLDLVHLDRAGYDGKAGTELADEIQTANSLLSELVSSNPQFAGMGTTVTALLLDGTRLEMAHIGDSRAYRLRDGVFEQASRDHTFVQRLIDEGRLRPEDADVHPHKNVLMRVLGDVDASPELDLQTFEVQPGERWLLCSDGLNAVISDTTVEEVLSSTPDLQECVDNLVELTLAGGSPDNVTVAVVEVVDDPLEETALPAGTAAEHDGEHPSDATNEPVDNGHADTEAPVRADLIRRDLSSRPHVLVGSAALATETGQIPIVTQRSNERRAAMMLTHRSPSADAGEAEPEEGSGSRKRWLVAAAFALMAVTLAAVLWFGYAWTQTRYYLAPQDNRVAIFNGVSQSLGPVQLSHVDEVTDIPVSNLPEYQRNRLANTLPARDLEHAQQIVDDLRSELRAVDCEPVTPRSPSLSPTSAPERTSKPKDDVARKTPEPRPSPSSTATQPDAGSTTEPAGPQACTEGIQ
jgi:serine/threonine protein phosphatase PrpC